jgi:hypothetical protein
VTLDVLRGGCGPLNIMLTWSYSWIGEYYLQMGVQW